MHIYCRLLFTLFFPSLIHFCDMKHVCLRHKMDNRIDVHPQIQQHSFVYLSFYIGCPSDRHVKPSNKTYVKQWQRCMVRCISFFCARTHKLKLTHRTIERVQSHTPTVCLQPFRFVVTTDRPSQLLLLLLLLMPFVDVERENAVRNCRSACIAAIAIVV